MRVLSISLAAAALAATLAACSSSPPELPEPVRQTQAAYQIAFDEFERLSREGGTDEPSEKMLEVAQDNYLKKDLALLGNQKDAAFTVEGKPGTTKFRSTPGTAEGGSDPQLTLQVCEDRRGSFSVYPDGRRVEERISQGSVFAKLVDGKAKLVEVTTNEVEQCDW